MASAQLQANAMGPGKGEEVGSEVQGPEQAGRVASHGRMCSQGATGPWNQATHNTHLQDRPQSTVHVTEEQTEGPETEGTCPRSHRIV